VATVHTNLRWFWPSPLTTQQMIDICSSLQQKAFSLLSGVVLRVSPYIDNVDSDIQRLISALQEAIH
jgi:selenocysteine lyase/cysteine desulfurase